MCTPTDQILFGVRLSQDVRGSNGFLFLEEVKYRFHVHEDNYKEIHDIESPKTVCRNSTVRLLTTNAHYFLGIR